METQAANADRPLRVALVGDFPAGEDAVPEGGVQSVTHSLAHALARRRSDTIVERWVRAIARRARLCGSLRSLYANSGIDLQYAESAAIW